MQQLIEMAAQMFMQNVKGSNTLNLGSVVAALQGLLPTEGGELDLSSLVAKFMEHGGGLAAMAQSFLSDGSNDSMGGKEILELFGSDAVAGFANKLGLGTDIAASGLADTLPELLDKTSESGNLLANPVANLGKKLLSGFF